MEIVRTVDPASVEIDRLKTVIIDALAAMDNGEYGTARKILRTGKDTPLKVVTGVLAKGQP